MSFHQSSALTRWIYCTISVQLSQVLCIDAWLGRSGERAFRNTTGALNTAVVKPYIGRNARHELLQRLQANTAHAACFAQSARTGLHVALT